MKLAKKWLYVIISVSAAVVVATSLALGLGLGLKKNKQNQVSTPWELVATNTTFVMGDLFDPSGFVLRRTKNGEEIVEQVDLNMVVLPQMGIDHASGLNKNAMFLEAGEKQVTIVAFGNSFVVGCNVLEDRVVSLVVPAENTIELVEQSRAEDAAESIPVYASTLRGRTIRLLPDMYFVKRITALDGSKIYDKDFSASSTLAKTNATVFAQDIEVEISYVFESGVNLPLSQNQEVIATAAARIVDNNVIAATTSLGDVHVYSSSAASSDFKNLIEKSRVVLSYQNGDTEIATFTDGNFLFDIVETTSGKLGYAFAVDAGGNRKTFDAYQKHAYFLIVDTNGEQMTEFCPFGKDYDPDAMTDVAALIGQAADGRDVFVPSDSQNLVFISQFEQERTFFALVKFETRTGEVFVRETLGGDWSSSDALSYLTSNAPDQPFGEDTFFVVMSGGSPYFVSRDTYTNLVAGQYKMTNVYFQNFGFADQQRVYLHDDNYFYDSQTGGNIIRVANVTKLREAYFAEGTLYAYAVDRAFCEGLNLRANGVQVMVDGILRSVEVLSVLNNTFVRKVTTSSNFERVGNVVVLPVETDKIVEIASLDSTGLAFVGQKLDLSGFAFELVCQSGNSIVFEADRTYKLFGETKLWSHRDFSMLRLDGNGNATSGGLFEFDGEYFAKQVADISNIELCYVGNLPADGKLCCTASYQILADQIVLDSYDVNDAPALVVLGDQTTFLSYVLNKSSFDDYAGHIVLQSGRTIGEGCDFENIKFVAFDNFDFAPKTLYVYVDADSAKTAGEYVVLDTAWSAFDKAATKTSVEIGAHWLSSGNKREDTQQLNNAFYSGIATNLGVSFAGDKLNLVGFDASDFGLLGKTLVIVDLERGEIVRQLLWEDFVANPLCLSTRLSQGEFLAYIESEPRVALFFELEENDIVASSIDLVEDDAAPNHFADGLRVELESFANCTICMLSKSGNFLRAEGVSGTQLAAGVELARDVIAPQQKQTQQVMFDLLVGERKIQFVHSTTFFVKHNGPEQMQLNTNTAFVSDKFAGDAIPQGAQAAYFGRWQQELFATLSNYLDLEASLESSIAALVANIGFDIAPKVCQVKLVEGVWGLEILGQFFEIEEDYVVKTAAGDFARVVVFDTQIFVEIDDTYESGNPNSKKYKDLDAFCFDIWAGQSPSDLSQEIFAQKFDMDQLTSQILDVVASRAQDKLFVKTIVRFADGVGGELQSEFVVAFSSVPLVSGQSFETTPVFVENQLLSLAANPASAELESCGAQEYLKFTKLPAIQLVYTIFGESRQVRLDEFVDGHFFAANGSGVARYAVSGSGSLMRLGVGNTETLCFVFDGASFSIDLEGIVPDYFVGANFGSVSVTENSKIEKLASDRVVTNAVYASGKPSEQRLVFDKQGVSKIFDEPKFKLVVVVKNADGQIVGIVDAKDFDIAVLAGKRKNTNDFADRLFLFENDAKQVWSYELSVQPYSVDCEALFDTIEESSGKLDSMTMAQVEIEQDSIWNVDVRGMRTTYYAYISAVKKRDTISFESIEFEYFSGMKIVLSGEQNSRKRLVLTDSGFDLLDGWIGEIGREVLVHKFEFVREGELSEYATLGAKLETMRVDGREVGANFVSLVAGTGLEFEFEFAFGGSFASAYAECDFVQPNLAVEATFEPDLGNVGVDSIISLSDILSNIHSVTATLAALDGNGVVEVEVVLDALVLSEATGDHYELVFDGTAIKVLSSEFVWNEINLRAL